MRYCSWERSRSAVAVLAAASAACGDSAVLVEVRANDLSVPAQVDAFCLAVTDRTSSGGEFARTYHFGDDVEAFPQSLAVEAGGASSAVAWARGFKHGQEVARDRRDVDFGGDVSLTLARCPSYSAGAPTLAGTAGAPATARLALSTGRGGSWLVGVASGDNSAIFRVDDDLGPIGVSEPISTEAPRDLIAFDADGDCDDDLLIVETGTAPTFWRRDGAAGFVEAEDAIPSGATEARAAAAGDFDGDGDTDLVVVSEGGGRVWLNDGVGRFSFHPSPLSIDDSTDATTVVAADFDGDGDLDIAVGRGDVDPAPVRVHINAGGAAMQSVPAALPELAVRARGLVARDFDGDGLADLLVVAAAEPVRLYINGGDLRLEDRSFTALPSTDSIDAVDVVGGDWDGDCLIDVIIATREGPAIAWRGADGGSLVADAAPGVEATQLVLGELDDDGAPDLVSVGPDGVSWVAR